MNRLNSQNVRFQLEYRWFFCLGEFPLPKVFKEGYKVIMYTQVSCSEYKHNLGTTNG